MVHEKMIRSYRAKFEGSDGLENAHGSCMDTDRGFFACSERKSPFN